MTTKSFSLMRFMQLCLLLAITSMAFTACDKDDDEDVASANGGDLISRWELTEDRLNGVTDDYYPSGEYIIQFNADGTGMESVVGEGSYSFSWRREGNTLWYDGDAYSIIELSSTRLILEYDEKGSIWTDIYRRIN